MKLKELEELEFTIIKTRKRTKVRSMLSDGDPIQETASFALVEGTNNQRLDKVLKQLKEDYGFDFESGNETYRGNLLYDTDVFVVQTLTICKVLTKKGVPLFDAYCDDDETVWIVNLRMPSGRGDARIMGPEDGLEFVKTIDSWQFSGLYMRKVNSRIRQIEHNIETLRNAIMDDWCELHDLKWIADIHKDVPTSYPEQGLTYLADIDVKRVED